MQLGGLTGAEIVRQRKEAEEKSQYVYDYYYLKGVAADDVNNNGGNKASWNWKAGGAGSSNSDGTITSTVSANTTAGFSIVTYTGNGQAASFGHGLSTPDIVLTFSKKELF